MRIVIVEDEKITRQWMERQIAKLKPDQRVVGSFSNGREALGYLGEHGADVLFTDIRMPVMDGLELLGELQRRGDPSYKVILSAYDDFQYAQQALRLGAKEFLLKPEITPVRLAQVLEDAAAFHREGSARKREEALYERQEMWMRQALSRGGYPPDQMERGIREQEIGLAEEGLRAMCASFAEAVPQEKVRELLELFFAEEKTGSFCFHLAVQDFFVLYNESGKHGWEETAERLWLLLRVHMGMDVYLGVSGEGDGYGQIARLCRQALVAKENRQFFGISGCRGYGELRIPGKKEAGGSKEEVGQICEEMLREILDALERGAFGEAMRKAEDFFDAIGGMQELPASYVMGLGREMLTACIRRLRPYPLSEAERERLHQCEMLLGMQAFGLRQFREEILGAFSLLSGTLTEKDSRYSAAVQRVIQYVEEHYAERISLEQVAAHAFLSRSYVSSLFRKETGERFSDYLQRVRLEKACVLLKEGNASIQETADRTGFFDTAHFSRVFKEKMGLSPLEYRRACFHTKKE